MTVAIKKILLITIGACSLTLNNRLPAMHLLTPLMLAIKNTDISEVGSLIAAKANVNGKTNHGISPLALAASKGDLAITALLLNAGANVRKASIDNVHPALLAIMGNHFTVAQELAYADATQNEKHVLLNNRHTRKVSLLNAQNSISINI